MYMRLSFLEAVSQSNFRFTSTYRRGARTFDCRLATCDCGRLEAAGPENGSWKLEARSKSVDSWVQWFKLEDHLSVLHSLLPLLGQVLPAAVAATAAAASGGTGDALGGFGRYAACRIGRFLCSKTNHRHIIVEGDKHR